MSEVDLVHAEGVATLTLNRPDRLNAYDLALAAALRTTVDAVAESDAEVLVVAAAGRAFCAGGDVREMAASGDPEAYLRALTRDVHAALAGLRALRVPVIARVHGTVAGGGLGLVLAADVVIAAERATFAAAYGAIGLSPDCGVTALLPGVVGTSRARDFLIRGRRLDAATALAWGLVGEVTSTDDLETSVDRVAAEVRIAGRAATGATKRLLDRPEPGYEAQLEREALSIAQLAGSVASTRIKAFAER